MFYRSDVMVRSSELIPKGGTAPNRLGRTGTPEKIIFVERSVTQLCLVHVPTMHVRSSSSSSSGLGSHRLGMWTIQSRSMWSGAMDRMDLNSGTSD